jgi:hypothetical protein
MPIMDMMDTIDRETLEKAEREQMERPSNAAFWDDRMYNTHAPTLTWCDRGDDLLEESNYKCALERLEAIAREDDEESDDVLDLGISHWAYGSIRQIFVRVRDEDGEFTNAWIESVKIALELQDYPVLDESDYSEREWEAYEDALREALEDAQRAYWLDTVEEAQAIQDAWYEDESADHRTSWAHPDEVNWERVALDYAKHRDAYFSALGREYLNAQIPGQGELSL